MCGECRSKYAAIPKAGTHHCKICDKLVPHWGRDVRDILQSPITTAEKARQLSKLDPNLVINRDNVYNHVQHTA
jgi:hypothetical protein